MEVRNPTGRPFFPLPIEKKPDNDEKNIRKSENESEEERNKNEENNNTLSHEKPSLSLSIEDKFRQNK